MEDVFIIITSSFHISNLHSIIHPSELAPYGFEQVNRAKARAAARNAGSAIGRPHFGMGIPPLPTPGPCHLESSG